MLFAGTCPQPRKARNLIAALSHFDSFEIAKPHLDSYSLAKGDSLLEKSISPPKRGYLGARVGWIMGMGE